MKRSDVVASRTALLILSVACGSGAAAQTAEGTGVPGVLEEITVTAEKRSESIQDLPIAISAYSGATLQHAGVEGLRGLGAQAPSLQIGALGAETFISIRGVGAEVNNIGAESGVAVAQNGVVFARHVLFDAEFLDVARVEVLRGPQGTISGRNSTGGAVNVITNAPTEQFAAAVETTIGNYNRFASSGYLSGPIADGRLLARLALRTDHADGWLNNSFLNEKQGSRDKVHARACLAAHLRDNVEATLHIEGLHDQSLPQRIANVGRARPDAASLGEVFGVPDFDLDALRLEAGQRRDYERKQYGASLGLTVDLDGGATLTSTSGYWTADILDSGDADGTRVSIADNPLAKFEIWQASQELTLTADLTDRLDLILGGLYLRENARQPLAFVAEVVGIAPGLFLTYPEQDLSSYSGYTQLRYKLAPSLRLSAGVRYTYDSKEYFEEGFRFGPIAGGGRDSWDALTPRLALDYQPSDAVTLFANVARGFKAGGFNTLNFDPVDVFNPEFVWSYEAGAKISSLDDRVRTAATAFFMDYTDLQQVVFRNIDGTVVSNIENAAKASIMGVELELDAQLSESFRLGLAATWLDTEFDELRAADPVYPELGTLDPSTGLPTRDLSGNELARSPAWQLIASGEYTLLLRSGLMGSLRADYNWRDDQFFNFYNHELVSQAAYGVLNLNASVQSEDGRWRVSVFVRNALDERYLTNALETAILPGVPTNLGHAGEPRMYGASVAFKY